MCCTCDVHALMRAHTNLIHVEADEVRAKQPLQ